MKKVGVFLALVAIASLGHAGTMGPQPYVAGSFDAWAGPNSFVMTETGAGTDIWTYDFSGLAANSRFEFKITDGTWGLSTPGPNSWGYSDGDGNLTVSYDGNVYADGWSPSLDRIGVSTDGSGAGWLVAGNFQVQIGGGSDWNNADPNTAMSDLGGGIYEFTAVLTPGSYAGKVVAAGTWDSISWDARSVGTSDNLFDTDLVNDTVVFTIDSFAGVSKVTVIPEPTTLALGLIGLGALLWRRRR